MRNNITVAQERLANRTDEELLRDWNILDASSTFETMTVEMATVRGWFMDEIEKRWPVAFDNWIENCHIDDNLENYIKKSA